MPNGERHAVLSTAHKTINTEMTMFYGMFKKMDFWVHIWWQATNHSANVRNELEMFSAIVHNVKCVHTHKLFIEYR